MLLASRRLRVALVLNSSATHDDPRRPDVRRSAWTLTLRNFQCLIVLMMLARDNFSGRVPRQ